MNQKPNKCFLLLGAVVSLFVVVPIPSAPGAELGKWTTIMESRNNTNVFDAIDDSTPAWPKVHSPEYIAGLKESDRQVQIEFLTMSSRIVRDAKRFVNELPNRNSAENQRRLDTALKLRDNMLASGGYANLVIADGMNHICIVILCKRLGTEGQVSPEFERALSRLLTYRVNPDKWVVLAREEMGWPAEKFKEVEGAPREEIGFQKLWELFSNGDDFMFPHNKDSLARGFTDDLLKRRNLSALLYRYIYGDIMMKKLSLAAQYKKETRNFSLTDGAGKISKVLQLPDTDEHRVAVVTTGGVSSVVVTKITVPVDRTSLSVGEQFLGRQLSSYDVADLLNQIKSGDIDKFMVLYLSDILPKRADSVK